MRLQIIPDYGVDNKNTDTMVNNLHRYRSPLKRLTATKEAITFHDQYVLSYEIELTKNTYSFNLWHDDNLKDTVNTELNITFPKSTFKESKNTVNFKNPIINTLETKYHYFLSLKIDKRGLAPLPSILETTKLFKDEDKAFIQIIFEPESLDWYRALEAAIKDFRKGSVTKKIELNKEGITTGLLKAGIKTLQETLSVISFLLTDEEMKFDDIDSIEYQDILRQGLSANTQNKSKWNGFNTQIRLVVDSKDTTRKESIMRGLTTAFQGLNEDNKIVSKRVEKPEKYIKFIKNREIQWTLNKNILSAAELGQLIQMPTKAYQEIYKIKSIDTREVILPKELFEGFIKTGYTKYKGPEKATYWNDNKNILALPKIIIGPMGSGKSEYTKKFCVEAAHKGDSLIVFDYIKDCELSEGISKNIKNCIKINLADPNNLYALAFPEMQPGENTWDRLRVANTLSRQVEYLINALSDTSTGELTAPMIRYLNACCMVVFIHPNKTIDDVFQCLRRWQVRNEYIRLAKYSGCFAEGDDIYSDLEELHERDSECKIVGTREHLIIGIINRISALNKDIYLKRMLKAEINYEQNFAKWMDEGKVILIQMPESTFTSKSVKDTLVTYYMSRVWLAALQRKNHSRVCHVITDEVHQVPTAATLVTNVITEGRKFGIGFFFTIHFMKQFKALHDAVKSAGCSYMLLAGTEKENLKTLEEEIRPFTIEEGLSLKPFHSLNIINIGNQYAKFISRLPRPI